MATGLNLPAIRAAVIDHALSLGIFESVSGHEPKAAPTNRGITGAVWSNLIEPARGGSGLDATSLRWALNVRLAIDMLAEPQDDVEDRLVVAGLALMSAYSGDFDLGDLVREVDLLGQFGTPMTMTGGYLNQDNRLYRVQVINLPLICNDVFLQAP